MIAFLCEKVKLQFFKNIDHDLTLKIEKRKRRDARFLFHPHFPCQRNFFGLTVVESNHLKIGLFNEILVGIRSIRNSNSTSGAR